LTMQQPANSGAQPTISANGSKNLCAGSSVTLTATAGTSFLWNTGDTTQSITVSQAGSYSCTVTNLCGTSTSNPFIVNSVTPNSPTVIGDTICVEGVMNLSASGSGTLNWFDAQNNLVGTGSSFTTPNLNITTSYFVENTDSYNDTLFAEPHTNGIGGGGYVSSAQYNIFNAHQSFVMKSALVYAQSAGNISIALQDETGATLQSTTVTVPAGESRVNLNFNIPADSNLRIGVTNTTTTGLYRNNNSATYPYNLQNIMSIIGASAGASYYYYLYDLEILTQNGTCTSPRVQVDAVVESCAAIGENIAFNNSININPNPNSGNFTVEFEIKNTGDITLDVVNLIGQKVNSLTLRGVTGKMNQSMDCKSLSKGVYLLNIIYEGKVYTKKFIKE
jgi:carboxypeptidase D